MRIDAIEILHLGLPLKARLTGPASRYEKLETVLVGLHGEDAVGWGEASPGNAPLASREWAAGAFGMLRDWLGPAIVGQSVNSGEQLTELLDAFRGQRFAKAAIDMAWWDLQAKLKGQPLHQYLGGKRRQIDVGLTFDQMEDPDAFLDALRAGFEAGFARAKLKFRPGWEIRMLEAVRRELPTETLHADVEGALTLGHTEILYRLDDFMLAMVEQPLLPEELVGHAMLQESLRTPICLDESLTMPAEAEMAFDLKSCRYVNLKPGRLGGLTAAIAVHDLALQHEVPCYVGAMPQTTIGARFAYALAAKDNCGSYPADYFPSEQFLLQDAAAPLTAARDPQSGLQRIALWPEPGIGVEPDLPLLKSCQLAHARI